MRLDPRLAGFGDTSTPGSSAAQPGTLPMIPQDDTDFFDPMLDGADIMYYACNLQGLAPAASGTTTIQIDSGVDFYWVAATYQADLAGALQTESSLVIPLVNVLINDTGSRKNLQNTPIPISSIAGFGERPYRLIRPRVFRASSTINFTWTSISAAQTYTNLFFVMHGYVRPRAQD